MLAAVPLPSAVSLWLAVEPLLKKSGAYASHPEAQPHGLGNRCGKAEPYHTGGGGRAAKPINADAI